MPAPANWSRFWLCQTVDADSSVLSEGTCCGLAALAKPDKNPALIELPIALPLRSITVPRIPVKPSELETAYAVKAFQ